jgi:hypothetical protein
VFTAILATVWHNLTGLNNYHSSPVVYHQRENGANVVRSNENPYAKNPFVSSGSAKDESPLFASESETSRVDKLQGWIHSSLKGHDIKSPNEITREEQSVLGDVHRDMSRDEFTATVRRPTSKSVSLSFRKLFCDTNKTRMPLLRTNVKPLRNAKQARTHIRPSTHPKRFVHGQIRSLFIFS